MVNREDFTKSLNGNLSGHVKCLAFYILPQYLFPYSHCPIDEAILYSVLSPVTRAFTSSPLSAIRQPYKIP